MFREGVILILKEALRDPVGISTVFYRKGHFGYAPLQRVRVRVW